MPPLSLNKKLLLIGASRGLGFALAEEYLKRGWDVVATERGASTSKLHKLAQVSDGRLEIEDRENEALSVRCRLPFGAVVTA